MGNRRRQYGGVRSWRALVVVLTLGWAASACGSADRIRTVQDVPPDVASIVDDVWHDLEDRLSWAGECMLPVEVLLSRDVSDGSARYRAEEQLIEIEIPTSPSRFRESLVHELGHHIDATCAGLDDLRAAFAAAQGFDEGHPWNEGASWEVTPSEHFAEAVVLIVTGDRLVHADIVLLETAAVAVVTTGTNP